jgi:hypothetical protein
MSRSLACMVLLVNLLAPAAARAQARAPFQVGVHGGFNFTMGGMSHPSGSGGGPAGSRPAVRRRPFLRV